MERKPREDASVLGRVLHTWTGVAGDKQPNLTRFPTFPEYAPAWVARPVARTYVALRGVDRSDKSGRRVQIQEDRSAQFRERVISLLERVGSPHTVRGDSWPIYVVDETAESLYELPEV